MNKLLLITLLFLSSVNLSDAQPLTLEDIVSIPDVSNVQLSPNGQFIAYLMRIETETHSGKLINIYDTKDETVKKLAYTDNNKYIIYDIFWGNNDVILIKAKYPSRRGEVKTIETRLFNLNRKDGKLSAVIPKSYYKRMLYLPNIQSTVVDLLPDDENHILMSLAGFSADTGKTVLRFPITGKGKSKTIQRSKSNVESWVTDVNHNVRIAILLEETTYTIEEKISSGKFKELWTFEAFSEEAIWPLGFGADNNTLYVKALYNGKDAIYKVDLTDKSLQKELVYYKKNYDVTGQLRRSKKTNEIVGIGYNYWDEEYKKLIEMLDEGLPDTDNLLLDKSEDGNKYILLASNDNEPGNYYIGDKKNNNIKFVARKHKKLAPNLLSQKTKIKYKARDGLEIEGFITLPQGKKTKNLPTIIFPHGGPISRDGSGFDYWTQYFANKGYAVFQMNFRGSSGYGHDFMKQGIASWGQAMQDDVEDGTHWLIKEGTADKNNICIAGASYGGYAALMGGIKTPDLYKCIISFAGVSDVQKLVASKRNYTNHDVVKKQIGSDYSSLWEASPLKHADSITKPVLLIHGSKDRVVKTYQSEKMYDKLKGKKKGKIVEYHEIEGANHYLSNNEHRLQTFRAIDSFLNKYLPTH